MSKQRQHRRTFLRGAGLTIAALAGCSSPGNSDENPTASATDTSTASPTESPSETETATPADYDWFHERGTVLDDFQSVGEDWDATFGSAALEGAGFLQGSAVRMASNGKNRVRIERSFATPEDLTDVDFSLAVNLESTEREIFTVRVVLKDTAGNLRYHSKSILPAAADRWTHLDMGFDHDRGTFDPSSVTELWVEHFAGDGESAFRVADLRAVEKPEAGAVIFSFDDAVRGDYEYAYPVLSEYGYRGVCFPPTKYVDENTNPTTEQYREIREQGWDIGGHTPDHERLPDYSKEEQRRILRQNVQQLREMGLTEEGDLLHFRTPFSQYDAATLDVVLDEFETSIVGSGSAKATSFNVTDPRLIGFKSGEKLAETKSYIDVAAEHRQLVGLTMHTNNIDREHLEALVEHAHTYAEQGNLEVLSLSEFYEKSLGN